jgi:hypothetical protein
MQDFVHDRRLTFSIGIDHVFGDTVLVMWVAFVLDDIRQSTIVVLGDLAQHIHGGLRHDPVPFVPS